MHRYWLMLVKKKLNDEQFNRNSFFDATKEFQINRLLENKKKTFI